MERPPNTSLNLFVSLSYLIIIVVLAFFFPSSSSSLSFSPFLVLRHQKITLPEMLFNNYPYGFSSHDLGSDITYPEVPFPDHLIKKDVFPMVFRLLFSYLVGLLCCCLTPLLNRKLKAGSLLCLLHSILRDWCRSSLQKPQ